MKKYFAVADVVPAWKHGITAGKEYEITSLDSSDDVHGRGFEITDDNGLNLYCFERHCAFIDYGNWRIIEREVPDTEKDGGVTITGALDTQVGGAHYKSLAIQPIEYIHKNGLGYCEGNVIKYITRHREKGGAADLRKAIHYCQLILEMEYAHGE